MGEVGIWSGLRASIIEIEREWNGRNAYLHEEVWFNRVLFVVSSIVYFVPLMLHGITRVSVSIGMLGVISTGYHTSQSYRGIPSWCSKYLMWIDYIACLVLGIYIWYCTYNELGIWWYITGIFGVLILLGANMFERRSDYMLMHSIWHIVSAGLLYYCSSRYNSKRGVG